MTFHDLYAPYFKQAKLQIVAISYITWFKVYYEIKANGVYITKKFNVQGPVAT